MILAQGKIHVKHTRPFLSGLVTQGLELVDGFLVKFSLIIKSHIPHFIL
jgi:hypothetical protein